MANTYTQLFVQLVYAVEGRQNLIPNQHREMLQKYTTAVVQNDGHKMLALYYMPDHVHLLVGLNPAIAISDMVQDVKRATTNFINENNLTASHFNWQKGFGGFTYSKRALPNVINYILNQENHHKKKTFRQEYLEFLEKFEVEYNENYLFEFYD